MGSFEVDLGEYADGTVGGRVANRVRLARELIYRGE